MRPLSETKTARSSDPWAPYVPSDEAPWNLRRVVHLHRRAGFAATWGEIQRDLKDGPRASLDRVLAGKAATDGVPAEFERTADLLGESAVTSGDPARLKAWWLYRMLFGPDPLTERLTLMWHNHFATSNLKVGNLGVHAAAERVVPQARPGAVRRAAGRRRSRPGDADVARRPEQPQGPPEREPGPRADGVLQPGHRPLHRARRQGGRPRPHRLDASSDDAFAEVADRHDDGEKTILGQTGRWKGDDLVRMVLEHPATARRLAWRVCELFLAEKALKTADLEALADGLRAHDLDIGWAVETVLRSQALLRRREPRRSRAGPGGVRHRGGPGPGAVRAAAAAR